MSHQLVHHGVTTEGPNSYRVYTMQFASTWVAKKLIKLREVKSRDQWISIATGREYWGSALHGHVF